MLAKKLCEKNQIKMKINDSGNNRMACKSYFCWKKQDIKVFECRLIVLLTSICLIIFFSKSVAASVCPFVASVASFSAILRKFVKFFE